jgi:hypothetical protein
VISNFGDVFFPFAIEVFGCLHHQVDNSFHQHGLVGQRLERLSFVGFVLILK